MKIIYCLLAIIIFSACGNKKAEIVEEIKKTQAELADVELNRKDYISASTKLQAYYTTLESSKKYKSKQMEMDAQTYKEGYETAINHLKETDPEILKDKKKLDSVAFQCEIKANDLKHRIDSLELELKKY